MIRILHVDDEPDIRKIAELSLNLNPELSIRSCASGAEAIAVAIDWQPHLIICDVMMPTMDGPATLAQLRRTPATAAIPLIFMTARAQASELSHLKSLGAAAVIPKPFDPMTLAGTVLDHLQTAQVEALRVLVENERLAAATAAAAAAIAALAKRG